MWNTYTHNITYNTYPTVVLYEMWLPVILRMISFLETPIVQISWPHSTYNPTGKLYNYPFTSGRGQSMRCTKGWSDPELLQLSYDHGGSSVCRVHFTSSVLAFASRSGASVHAPELGCQESDQMWFPVWWKKTPPRRTGALGRGPSWGPPRWWKGRPGSHRSTRAPCQPGPSSRTCWPRDPWQWSPRSRHTSAAAWGKGPWSATGQCGFTGGRYEETIIYNSIVFPNLKGVLACPLVF